MATFNAKKIIFESKTLILTVSSYDLQVLSNYLSLIFQN